METYMEVLSGLTDEAFAELEARVEKMLSVWEIKNLRGQAATFHDDQHIGEPRRELKALKHPSFDVEGEMAFRAKAVVDSLEGNSLIHPLTTPIIEVDETCTKARAVWWSLGVEGLSKFREQPLAIISLGMVPGTHVKEDGNGKSSPAHGRGLQRTNIIRAGYTAWSQPTQDRLLHRSRTETFLGNMLTRRTKSENRYRNRPERIHGSSFRMRQTAVGSLLICRKQNNRRYLTEAATAAKAVLHLLLPEQPLCGNRSG